MQERAINMASTSLIPLALIWLIFMVIRAVARRRGSLRGRVHEEDEPEISSALADESDEEPGDSNDEMEGAEIRQRPRRISRIR